MTYLPVPSSPKKLLGTFSGTVTTAGGLINLSVTSDAIGFTATATKLTATKRGQYAVYARLHHIGHNYANSKVTFTIRKNGGGVATVTTSSTSTGGESGMPAPFWQGELVSADDLEFYGIIGDANETVDTANTSLEIVFVPTEAYPAV